MMSKKKYSHVVLKDNGFWCKHCNDFYIMNTPVDLDVMAAAMKAYFTIHKKCKKKEE